MSWRSEFTDTAQRNLDKLPKEIGDRLVKKVDQIQDRPNPRSVGKSIQDRRFKDCWLYRVGDYRLICYLDDQEQLIRVLTLGHRKDLDDLIDGVAY